MIPVVFKKDDLSNPKKGTINPEALASLVGFAYSQPLGGVLDIFENPVESILPPDLTTAGYVKLTFSKGYVCAYGRLVYIEQGEEATIALPSSSFTGYVGIRIDLSAGGSSQVTWKLMSTLSRDNLLDKPTTGKYDIPLYAVTASASSFTLGTRVARKIQKFADYMKGENFTTQSSSDNSTKLATTQFVNTAIYNAKPEQNTTGFLTNSITLTQSGDIDTSKGYAIIGKNLIVMWGSYHTNANEGTDSRPITIYFPQTVSELYNITLTPFSNSRNLAEVWVTKYGISKFEVQTESDRANFTWLAIGKAVV